MTQGQPTKWTYELRFRIVEPSPGVFTNSKPDHYLWFRVLEQGVHYGKDISVPTRHPAYAESLGETLRSLDDGDIVTAVLVSNSEGPSNWRVKTIETVSSSVA